jgi:hypothetical protein
MIYPKEPHRQSLEQCTSTRASHAYSPSPEQNYLDWACVTTTAYKASPTANRSFNICDNKTNGKVYKMTFEYDQLLAGVQYPILQNLKPCLPHINNPMITTIWQFLAESQLNIVIPGLYSPQPLQENDNNIMGELMKIEKSPIAIQRVNQC